MAWWDGITQWVEDRKKDYEELDKNLGGWLPGGYEGPPPRETAPEPNQDWLPGMAGLEEARRQAYDTPTNPWKATSPDIQVDEMGDVLPRAKQAAESVMQGHLSAPIRDWTVLGGVARAPEFVLNALNQASERTWQPFWGELGSRNPGYLMAQANQGDWAQQQQANFAETPQQMLDRMAAAAGVVTGTDAQRKAAIEKGRNLSMGTQLVGAVVDPVNFVGLPGALKPTTWKKGAMAARAIKPMEELSLGERLLSGTAKMTGEQAEAATADAFRQKNILTRVAEKVPVLGRPLAALTDLTPRSKMAEDIATVTDTIIGRSGNALKDVGPDAGKMVEALAQVVEDIKAPTEVAVKRMGGSARAAPTRLTSKYLQGFDPQKVVTDWQDGQGAIAEVAKLRNDLKLGKKIDQAALAKAEKIAKNAPQNVEEAIAQYGRNIIDHVAGQAKELYRVSDTGLDERLIKFQKNILGVGMLATNPNYPITNASNNLLMTLLAGYNPFRAPGKSEAVMREAGMLVKGKGTQFAPSRAAAAMGMADMENLGNWKSKTFLGMAQKVEKIQGEGLWSQALEKYLGQAKRLLFPPDLLGPQLRQTLNGIDPRLAGWIQDAARHSNTPADAIKKINSLPGMKGGAWLPSLDSMIPDIAKNDDDLRGFLKAGVLDPYRDRLMATKNVEEFRAIIAEAKAKLVAMRGKAMEVDTAAGGSRLGVSEAARNFFDEWDAIRNAAFATGVDIRKAGAADEATALAENFAAMREKLQATLNTLTEQLGRSLPAERVENITKTFKAWETKQKAFEDAKLALVAKHGANTPEYQAAYGQMAAAYTKSMKKVVDAATMSVKGILEEVLDVPGMTPERKALWTAYWKKARNPVRQEETGQALYGQQKKAVVGTPEELAKTGEYHDWRQGEWGPANAEKAELRKQIFGEAQPAPANLKSQNVIPAQPIGTPKAQAQLTHWERVGRTPDGNGIVPPNGWGEEGAFQPNRAKGYREFSMADEVLGPDVSWKKGEPFGWSEFVAEFDLPSTKGAISHHPGSYRGDISKAKVTRIFYEPEYLVEGSDEFFTRELAKLRQKFPDAEFVRVADNPADPGDKILLRQTVAEAATATVPAPKPTLSEGQVAPAAGDNPYLRYATLKWDTFDKALDEMLVNAERAAGQQVAGTVDRFTRKEILNTVQKQAQNYTDARLAAIAKANADRDFAMLNYSHKYGFDHYLSVVMPFAFWQNATMKNMVVRFMEQPGLFFAYSKYKQMLNDSEDAPGFPARLRGMLRVALPRMPAWMGDQFVDVLGKALPFNQMMYPLQAAQWDQEDQSSLMGLLGSVSPMWTIPANLASGNAKEIGTLFPATRQFKATTALYKEAELPGGEKIRPGGENLEGGVRQMLQGVAPGLPMVDQWDNYRVDRMLANMVKMGEITDQEATLAIRDKSGPIWDRATQKAAVESGIGQLPGLSGLVTLKTYPKGEEQLKADKAELDALVAQEASKAKGSPVIDMAEAWAINKEKGLSKKGTVISQWYADHPAYSVRTLATTPEADQGNKADTTLTWDELNEGTVPNKWKVANLSAEEQAALQAFYDKGNAVDKLTPAEKAALQTAIAKINAGRDTPEFQNIAALSKEIGGLIDQEFARLGGPAGETNKYDWITKANGGKTTATIAKWYADHPEYSNYGKAAGTSTGSTYKPYTSNYKPYTKAPFKVYAGKELSFLSKWTTPDVVKAFKLYAKSGKLPPDLAQKLYEIYQKNKGALLAASFEEWIRTLLKQVV